jgi:hypothetical protein
MNAITKTKFGFYIAMIFVAGVVSGGVIAFRKAQAKSQLPSMEKVCHRMDGELKSRLGLTEDEFARIRPILEKNTREIQGIHARSLQEIDATIRKHHEELARLLTPGQQQKLVELDAERREFMGQRGKKRDFDSRISR